MKTYFFDAYAFMEIMTGNPNYKKYNKEVLVITTKIQLMEFYYALLRNFSRETAETYYDELKEFCVEPTHEQIKYACLFKHQEKRRKLSYSDALAYIISLQRGIKFLTGDKEFENMDNVEFVK